MVLPSFLSTAAATTSIRTLLAIFGGYAFTYACTAVLARLLPVSDASAVIIATLLSFVIYTLFILWAFAVHSLKKLALVNALALPLYPVGFWPSISGALI